MLGTISPNVARAAVALRRSHPHVPPSDVLDVVMLTEPAGLPISAPSIEPGTDFGNILAEVFDTGMAPADWAMVNHPNTPLAVIAALLSVWQDMVLRRFADRYGLTPYPSALPPSAAVLFSLARSAKSQPQQRGDLFAGRSAG